jgi:hypothetical protein
MVSVDLWSLRDLAEQIRMYNIMKFNILNHRMALYQPKKRKDQNLLHKDHTQ